MWALLATAAFSIGSSLIKGRDNAAAAKLQNVEIAQTNLRNAMDTAQSVNTMQAQATLLKDQAATSRSAAQRQAMLGQSGAEAQAASAGVRGASVDAVLTDIDRELGWANADLERTVDVEGFNMQTRLKSLISNAQAGVFTKLPVASTGEIFGNAIVAGAESAANKYANTYFKYGASK